MHALLHERTDALPFSQAVAAATAADRLGAAFAAGYQAALKSLFPVVGDRRAALCATEVGGGHPKAIFARLEDGAISGRKTFVTFGSEVEALLVVARAAGSTEPRLHVGLVEARGPGVTFEATPPLPFVPEVSHAQVLLE